MASNDSEEEKPIRVKEVDRVPLCSVSNAFSLGMSFCCCNFHLLRTIPFSVEVIEFSPLLVFKAAACLWIGSLTGAFMNEFGHSFLVQ
jgi:hypothetical protein